MRKSVALALGLIAAATTWATVATAVSDADNCEATKLKRAGQYGFCVLKAESKAVKTGDPVDYSKCDAKFADKWADADSIPMCPTSGDAATIQTRIAGDANDIVACLNGACPVNQMFPATGQTTAYGAGSDGDVRAGAPLSYTDNGDGTITDNNTGLMWEKKDDSGGIHDKDNTYTWCANLVPDGFCDNGIDMDGTIVSTFLAALNSGGGFAGHTDWRIPNERELQSILNYEATGPTVDPVFHQSATCTGCVDVTAATCSCTQSNIYWSSTAYAFTTNDAWIVEFAFGSTYTAAKPASLPARAVRGGL
jgi:hypothetical protein